MNHLRDFLSCLKTRLQPIASPEVMHRSMTTCHAINICLALKRDLKRYPQKRIVHQRPPGQPHARAGDAPAMASLS